MIKKVIYRNTNIQKALMIEMQGNKEDVLAMKEEMPRILNKLRKKGHLKNGYSITYIIIEKGQQNLSSHQ